MHPPAKKPTNRMSFRLSAFLKKRKENYIRNWKEQDSFERYGGILFFVIMMSAVLFAPQVQRDFILRYMNVFTLLFLTIMYQRIRKTKRELIDKNREIELQKQLIEEKQKEILDSLHYAKRIQTSLLPTDKYIERNLKQLNKN